MPGLQVCCSFAKDFWLTQSVPKAPPAATPMAELPEGMARGSMANLPIYLGQQTYSFAGPNDRIFVYPSVNIQLRFEEDASLCAPLALSPARARRAPTARRA